MNIDWSVAPEGFDYYLIGRSLTAPGKAYMKIDSVQRYVSASGSFVAFEDAGEFEIHRRPAWTGEGLPPVGIKVMTDLGTVMTECEVIGYYQKRDGGESWVVVALPTASKESRFIADRLVSQVFPIRTPEQIAAEDRAAAVAQMKQCFDSVSDQLMPTSNKYLDTLFGAFYDAGYRKEVKS